MNRDLFLDGFLDRIGKRFSLAPTFAFEILSIAAILDFTFDEVFDQVSTIENGSGTHDAGMDGIFLDDENSIMHVFQIKSGKNIGDNEIAKFVSDYRNLFVFGNPAQLPLNGKLQKAFDAYRDLALSGKTIDTQLHFVFGGELTNQNRELIRRNTDATESLSIYDRNDLFAEIESLIAEGRKRKPVQFSFMAQKSNISLKSDPQGLISFQIQNVKAINFRLAALDLCKLLDQEKQINKQIDSVFSDNIRGFLTYNRTNKKIKETLEGEFAEYFPFLNNGITIISEQVKIPKEMQAGVYPVQAKNPMIVNGLQTTNVIYDIYKKNPTQLDGVFVLVRLYETADLDLVEKITDATNTQSPINFRDKISNKDFNKYTKSLFELNGIGYINKRGETFENNFSISLKESIHADLLLKLWYASFYEKPDFAKNSKARVLEDLYDATSTGDHPLYPLFNGSPDSKLYEQLLTVYRIYRYVVTHRNHLSATNDFVLYADELFCYGIYKQGYENLETAYNLVFDNIRIICQDEKVLLEKNSVTYSHNSYLKSAKSRYDLDKQMGFIERSVRT